MRSTETTRSVPARSRSLLGLLTLGLLAGVPTSFAQTTLPGTTPTDTAPVTVPATESTQPAPVPNLGLPATGTEQVTPPPPTEVTPAQTTPADATDAAPTDAAPTDAAPVETTPAPGDLPLTASSLPAPGSVKVPVLEGEEVLKTVPTVLGEALVYAGDAGNVMARTLVALKADGYTAAGDEADTARVLLSRDGQEFELSGRESFGVTVVALSRVPGTAATDAAPTESAPTETAPTQTEPTGSPAEPDTDAPPATADPAVTDPATSEPAVPTPAQPPVEPTPVEPAPVTPGQP